MTKQVEIIVEKDESGLFHATSADVLGLYVCHRDKEAIRADIPAVIEALCISNLGIEVRVDAKGVSP